MNGIQSQLGENPTLHVDVVVGCVVIHANILMMILAWIIASVFASGLSQRVAISMECGLQNGTVAIAVATFLFGSKSPVVIPAATYSLTMFITALAFVYFLRRRTTPISS